MFNGFNELKINWEKVIMQVKNEVENTNVAFSQLPYYNYFGGIVWLRATLYFRQGRKEQLVFFVPRVVCARQW